jgi:hypothetical protein
MNLGFDQSDTFCGSRYSIDLDAMVANLTLEEGEQGLPAIVDPIRSGPEMYGKLPDGNFGGLGLQPREIKYVKARLAF